MRSKLERRSYWLSIIRLDHTGAKRRYRIAVFSNDRNLQVLSTVPLSGKMCAYVLLETLGLLEEVLGRAKQALLAAGHAKLGVYRFTERQLASAGLIAVEVFRKDPRTLRLRAASNV